MQVMTQLHIYVVLFVLASSLENHQFVASVPQLCLPENCGVHDYGTWS